MDLLNGLVGHWPLNRQSFYQTLHQFADKSTGGNHGTGSGVELGDTFDFETNQYSIGNGATPFNGATNHVNCGDSASFNFNETQSFTFSYWVKFPTGIVNPAWSMGKGDGLNGPGYGVGHWYTTDVPINPKFYLASVGTTVSVGGGEIERGIWGHYIWTINRTTNIMKSYKNSVYCAQADVVTVGDTSNSSDLVIGKMSGSNFTGSISDARIYNRVLSQGEILQLFLERPGVYETIKTLKPLEKPVKISEERSLIVLKKEKDCGI